MFNKETFDIMYVMLALSFAAFDRLSSGESAVSIALMSFDPLADGILIMDVVADLKERAVAWPRGNRFEDFSVGRVFKHHWGRTITVADNTAFTTLTLHYNPIYTNVDCARAHGHRDLVVCPLLLFNTVFGLSVEDLSEGGGPFLGVDKLTYRRPVIVGETVYADSEVVSCREAGSRPGYGIVTWHTKGLTETGDLLVDFRRTNLVRRRK